jgi:hypothetical protein
LSRANSLAHAELSSIDMLPVSAIGFGMVAAANLVEVAALVGDTARATMLRRWPSRLVATAAEDRLNVSRNPHTSFARPAIAEQSRFMSTRPNNERRAGGGSYRGLKVQILKASTDREIDAAFVSLAQARTGALLVGGDPFFSNRIDHVVALAARHAKSICSDSIVSNSNSTASFWRLFQHHRSNSVIPVMSAARPLFPRKMG